MIMLLICNDSAVISCSENEKHSHLAPSRGEGAGPQARCQGFFANFFGTILANAILVPTRTRIRKNPVATGFSLFCLGLIILVQEFRLCDQQGFPQEHQAIFCRLFESGKGRVCINAHRASNILDDFFLGFGRTASLAFVGLFDVDTLANQLCAEALNRLASFLGEVSKNCIPLFIGLAFLIPRNDYLGQFRRVVYIFFCHSLNPFGLGYVVSQYSLTVASVGIYVHLPIDTRSWNVLGEKKCLTRAAAGGTLAPARVPNDNASHSH